MTSFKSAQLIANSGDADKVVFLLDRIELSIQSLDEYRGFAGDDDSIQDTQNTAILVSKLRSIDPDDRLIVTSIQKMSNINVQNGIAQSEIDAIGRKRLVLSLMSAIVVYSEVCLLVSRMLFHVRCSLVSQGHQSLKKMHITR